ncbi:uncharacterized protein HMPREF1541_02458 [Cyphellophora europaea CBS 101466]|uniref:Cytochrome P450 n=1 Tax=Cyphellophora europaea (strain CBS 101466) TaxID=1220924 RepID=W2S5S6_CYPE1|nr:uncharacterized protein HMPREF1541_02458 [Cyphellophora europaea CBS 101466]ETN43299.1 hypothetical protein HMPREF1541_02458 [Cyphellophora europaea CBS 101466]
MAETTTLPILPTAALVCTVALGIYLSVIFPIFLHPLRHIPAAHWSIPLFGDCWILYQRFRSRNNAVTYAAHLKHGEVVRLGRNELSVNCVDNGIKTIYGGGFEKHAWYPQQFASYGVVNMFSTMHHAPHSQKKRTMANVYSKSFIAASPQVAANSKTLITTRFLPLIHSLAESGEPVNMHDVDNAMTMDFMSAYQYGLANSTNFTQDLAQRQYILHHYHSRRPYEFYSSELPWLKPMGEKVGIHLVPKLLDKANDILEDWGRNMCQGADSWLSNPTDNPGDEPVVYKQFKQGLTNLRTKSPDAGRAKEDLILPTHTISQQGDDTPYEVYSEMLDHLGAGHETSAVALTYLWHELAQNPTLQSALRKEIRTLNPRITWPLPPDTSPETFTLPSPKQIDALPLLQATLWEVLRLHAPIPGMEPRVTPPTPTGTTLGSYSGIPGGVRVSAMPYCLHRNPTVFPDPETFNPRRWLADGQHTPPALLKEMHRWFWAFGSGGRMCIGSHLAVQEIKLVVCALIGNYEVSVPEGGDEGIEAIDAYTVRPTSNRLMVNWKVARV